MHRFAALFALLAALLAWTAVPMAAAAPPTPTEELQDAVSVAAIVEHLERHGYDGWYVLEQDTILQTEPSGEGPLADVRTSVEFLRSQLERAAQQ